MRSTARRFLEDQHAATAVEYCVILAVLSLVIVSGIELSGNAIQNVWIRISEEIDESWRY